MNLMLQSNEQVGKLDREISFIRPVQETGDSNEDKLIDWELVSGYTTVSAGKKELKGNELVAADRIMYFQPTEWTIRYPDSLSDLTVKMRIVCDTRVYEITSIIEGDGRKRFLKIMTSLLDNVFFT